MIQQPGDENIGEISNAWSHIMCTIEPSGHKHLKVLKTVSKRGFAMYYVYVYHCRSTCE